MADTACLVFPELYRLFDKETGKKGAITPQELRNLVDLCNFCALCPCHQVRADLMKAKHAFVQRDGLPPTIRLLEDLGRVARVCGAYPRLLNNLVRFGPTGGFLRRLVGIHPERQVPAFPREDFARWARSQGLHRQRGEKQRKVAYFAGCTGRYLFPDVPKAVVAVLQRNGIEVYYPEQKCCGMPSLLEGDRSLTLEFAAFNVDQLAAAVAAGYDIVCSCPTCGYVLKSVLREGAFYAAAYRASLHGQERETRGNTGPAKAPRAGDELPIKAVFSGLFQDEGYFASIDARKRMMVARHTYDLGEYLRDLQQTGELNTNFGPAPAHMAYYPPCHLREQNLGEPYVELLNLVPGVDLERIEGPFHCCGIAGIMGFKRDFHEVSVAMGSRLMEKIKSINPERLLCDCLSCRMQFNQLVPYQVFHPVEILRDSYASY
jgi:glycerol-3-phosphate dehydrogenase subunit C